MPCRIPIGSRQSREYADPMFPEQSLEYGRSVNDPGRVALLEARCPRQLLTQEGDVLEVGVYKGGTLLMLARAVEAVCPKFKVIGVDTFNGHPYSDGHPAHPAGRYSDVSIDDLKCIIFEAGLAHRVELLVGKAEDIIGNVDISRTTFAHVDCDLYRPIAFCARQLPLRMHPSGAIIFDDYFHAHCPGATRALDELFGNAIQPIRIPKDGTAWSCEISAKLAAALLRDRQSGENGNWDVDSQ